MDKLLIRENIIIALSKAFIFIDSAEEGDINLESYIEDSIQFMSFVVELEEIFNIEIPPELLLFDHFKTIDHICLIIEEIIVLNDT